MIKKALFGFLCSALLLSVMGQTRQVIPEASHSGAFGLRILVTGQEPVFVEDRTPDNELHYRVRFYTRLDGLTMFEGDEFDLFDGCDLDRHRWFRLSVAMSGGQMIYRLQGLTNSLQHVNATQEVQVPAKYHFVELEFIAGSGDGAINFWLNDQPAANISNIQNSNGRIELVELGAVDGIDINTDGYLDFDDFVSNQGTPIGPIDCLSTDQYYQMMAVWPFPTTILDLLPYTEDPCEPLQ